jgi:hypothetical protein
MLESNPGLQDTTNRVLPLNHNPKTTVGVSTPTNENKIIQKISSKILQIPQKIYEK